MRKILVSIFVCGILFTGCTSNSTKLAIETSKEYIARNNDLMNKYHDLILQYMFTTYCLKNQLTTEQIKELNLVWNNRNVVEFWLIQHERNDALYALGVDTKLYNDQSMFSLFLERFKKDVLNPVAEDLGASISRWGVEKISEQD